MKRLFRKSLLASLLSLATLGQFSQPAVSQEPAKPGLEARFKQDINQVKSSNHKNLSLLMDYMQRKGLAIDSLITDKRFEIYEDIVSKFTQSAERKARNLDEYKRIHKFEDKKKRIFGFIESNILQLEKAEEAYDIPKEIISAIFGIESNFGRGIGIHNPFNAYVSMYVKNYRRDDLAVPQLQELLIFCRKNSLDVLSLKSSYAGAVSYAQFIPSSLNRWFIGNDLYDMDNNILSVANYLSYFKKRTGSLEESVYRYNSSRFYVRFVMELAREARKPVE